MMSKLLTLFATATLVALAAPRPAQACDKDKHGKEGCPHDCKGKSDPKDAEAAKRGEAATVVGTVSCATCEGKAEGPCTPKLIDTAGKTYKLTRNPTTHAIHEASAAGKAVEVSGNLLREGDALYLSLNSFRVAAARTAAGVNGIRLAAGDALTSMDVVDKNGSLLVVTTNGFGKQTPLKEYSPKGRATGGVSTIDQKALGEIGRIAAARVVHKEDDLTIITANGVALRLKVKDVRPAARATKGVHLIKPKEGDRVASVARIDAEDLKKAGASVNGGEESEAEGQPKLI